MSTPKRRHTLQIVALIALVAATTAVFVPLEDYLSGRMAQLRNEIVSTLERAVGRSVSYESISPSILRSVEVRGFSVRGQEEGDRPVLTVNRLRVRYSVWRLLFGDLQGAVNSVRIENTDIQLHHAKDAQLLELVTGSGGGGPAGLPRGTARGSDSGRELPNLDIVGRNLTVRYEGASEQIEAHRLSFSISVSPDEVGVSGSTVLDYRADDTGTALSEATVALEMEGRFTGRTRASGTVHISSMTTPLFAIEEQTFQVIRNDPRIEIRKVEDDAPANISVVANTETREVTGELLAESLVPAELVTLRGPLQIFTPWLQGTISGRGSLSYNGEPGSLAYSLDLGGTLTHPRITAPVRARADLSGNRDRVSVSELRVSSGGGDAVYQGSLNLEGFRPEGSIVFRDFVYGSIRPINGRVEVSQADGDILLRGSGLQYADFQSDNLKARFSASGERIDGHAVVSWGGDAGRSVILNGQFTTEEPLSATVSGRLRRFESSMLEETGLLTEASIPGPLRSASVSGRLVAAYREGELSVDVPRLVVSADILDSSDYAAFSARYEENRLQIPDLSGSIGDEPLSGRLSMEVQSRNTASFNSAVRVGDRDFSLQGQLLAGRRLTIEGNHDLSLRLTMLQAGGFVMRSSVEGYPLPTLGEQARLSMRTGGIYRPQEDWNLEIEQFEVTGVEASIIEGGAVAMTGQVGREGVDVSIRAGDQYSTLSGEGDLRFIGRKTWPFGEIEGEFTLSGSDSNENYSVSVSYADGALGADVVFANSPLRRLGMPPLRGVANGSLDYRSTEDRKQYDMSFSVENGLYNTDGFTASARISGTPQRIRLSGGDFTYLTHRFRNIRGSLNAESDAVSLTAVYEDMRPQFDTTFDVGLSGSLQGELESQPLSEIPFSGTVALTGMPMEEPLGSNWSFAVTRDQTGLRVRGAPRNAITGTIDPEGRFELSLGAPLPLRLDARGTLSEGQIEATLTSGVAEVGRLPTLFDWDSVSFHGGTVEGGLRIVGAVNDPDIYGTLTAKELAGRAVYVPEEIGPTRVNLVFQEKILEIRETVAPAGDARATVTGSLILNRWVPEEYEISITSPEENPVHVDYNFSGVVVDGYAIGSVTIHGTRTRVDITGDIRAWNTSITLGEMPSQEPSANAPYNSTVDVTARTGSRVEFSWPTRDFPVVRAIAQTSETLSIQADTDTESFSLEGTVGIQGGEIFYLDRSFYIREGEILFNEDEEQIDPRLSVRAELREITSEGDTRITLAVDNSRLSQFSPRFESSPPLTDAEIAAVLGRGLVSSNQRENLGLSTAVRLPSDLAIQFGLINSFENRVQDAFNLDLFSVRTQVFQRLAFGALQGSTYPLDNSAPSLGEYLDNTTVFMGKYLGSDLFLELLLQLRSSNPLSQDIQRLGGLEVDSELSIEWQTPFFLLDWNFFPRNPETLFVTDNTFEFSWEFSY